jgi:Tol biopolymer transport system component
LHSCRAAAAVLVIATTGFGSVAAQQSTWNVETPTGPTKQVAFETTEGTWMSVSVAPDGRTLVFDHLGHIYEIPIEGGTARRLTSGRSWNLFPRYSPDGTQIAFSSDRSGSHNVWVMDRQGGALRNLSGSTDNVYKPAWAPDGRRVFASTGGDGTPNQLVAYYLLGGRQVVVQGGGPVTSAVAEPGGAGVLYERTSGAVYPFGFNPYVIPLGGGRIERYDQATGETTVVVGRPGGAFAPALSADGRQLAYVHRSIDETVLIVRDLTTRRERVVLRGLDRDRQDSWSEYGPYPTLAWHPDGRRVILDLKGHLTAVDVTTGSATVIPIKVAVAREMSETIRLKTVEATGRATSRSHRWGSRTPQGIVFEALGDLWLASGTERRNLTHSDGNETSPVFDPATGALYYASWTDDSLGAVYRAPSLGTPGERLTSIPAQYGAIAVAPDGRRVAYVRGAGGLERGQWLSNETAFELVLRDAGGVERRLTGITGQPLEYANIAGKVPPSVTFAPTGETILFTEFERDTLVLKRIETNGTGETLLFRFPNAVAAVPSPTLDWIAIREYQRSFIVPFGFAGQPATVSPYEGLGSAIRVDPEDGAYLGWSADGRTLWWTRGSGFYEKTVDRIIADARDQTRPSGGSWTGPRVPGSTATRADLGVEFEIETPKGAVALTGARVVTMNPKREVLDRATIVVEGGRITAVGRGARIPAGAKVFDLGGRTIIPGIVDAHAHPQIEHSALHVLEQQPTSLSGPLAYGVTTVIEVYGNEYRDGSLSDQLRAGRMTGPRFFTTGSVIFGTRRTYRLRMFRPIETLDDAREQLRWNKDHGAIAVKDYLQLTRKRRHLVATAARELGLNMVSESDADPQMNFTQLMDGVTGIEHSMGLAPFYDDVVRYWGGTQAGMTPTLLVVYNAHFGEGWFHQASKLWEDPKLTRFIAPEQLMRVRNPTHLWPEDMYAWQMGAEVRKLFKNGTSIQLGAHGQMFGLDAHWEMQLLAKGGVTPAEVLEIATIRGATHHGLGDQLGSLEVGKLADLVVLGANPLVAVENALQVRYVMKNGVLYAGADAARVWPDPRPARKPYFMGR